MISVIFLFSFLFIIYFFIIGLRWLSFLPLFFMLFVIFNLSEDLDNKKRNVNLKEFVTENIFLIARCLILLGIYILLSYFDLDKFRLQILILINIVAFLISHITNYNEGKKIFHFGLYFSEIFLIFIFVKKYGLNNIIKLLNYLSILNFGIYTFIVFIVGLFKPISKNIKGLWFLFLNINTLFFIYNISQKNNYYAIFSTQIYLFILFLFLSIIKKLYNKLQKEIKTKQEENILEKILKGEKVFTKKTKIDYKKEIIDNIYNFINNLPSNIKFILGFLNLILIFIQIFLFTKQIGNPSIINKINLEILYWLAIIIFFINFLLLKYLNFYYQIQRIFFFFIINFGIYLSIINIFGKNNLIIVIIGITWNLLNSISIFILKKYLLNKILFIEDFYLWIISNIGALLVNLFFIFKLDLDYQLKIGIISIYLGIQIFLSFYNFKFLTGGK